MDYEYEYDEEPRGRVLWGRIGLIAIAILLVFFAGRCTAGEGDDGEELQALTQEVEDLREQRDALQAELDATEAGGIDSEPTATPDDGGGEDADDNAPAGEDTADDANGGGEDTADGGDGGDGDGQTTQTHEVQSNDTLYTIAEEYYGDGALFTLITDANNLSRDDPLRVGQILDIPPSP